MNINKDIDDLYNELSDKDSFWETIADKINWKYGTEYTPNAVRKKYSRNKKKTSRKLQSLATVSSTTRTQKAIRKSNNYERNVPFESRNVLVIGDSHDPFVVDGYVEFCKSVYKKFDCDTVVHIGDFVDQHAISFWDTDPDGMSAGLEAVAARKSLQRWYEAFPDVYVCVGNHDDRIYRQAFKSGLPRDYIRSMEEIWNMPDGWKVAMSFVSNNVVYEHGVTSGVHAAYNRAMKLGMSVVMGHTHITPGTKFITTPRGNHWGLNVGCGIDANAYAMAYGRQYSGEITIGCGVVLERGTLPIFVPM